MRKELPLLVNCGQIAYMSACIWDRGLLDKGDEGEQDKQGEGEDEVEGGKLAKTVFKTDLYIHGHFGFLHAKADNPLFPKYTSITTTGKGTGYERIYLRGGKEFFISTRFQEFRNAPLTGLIVTGITADNQRVLCDENDKVDVDDENLESQYSIVGKQKAYEIRRISIVAAFNKSIDPVKTDAANYTPMNTGFRLELALFAASILASRARGFKGCTFEEFLEHLAREFDFAGEYGDGNGPPAIFFDENFPLSIRQKKIPFLSSMAISGWDPVFAGELKDIFEANLGVAIASIKNATADLLITDYPKRDLIIIGECKLHAAPVSAGYIRKNIMKKFNNFPECNLFLAVAPTFRNLKKFYQNKEGIPFHTDTIIWILEKIGKRKKLRLTLAKTDYKPDLKNSKKHIIIMPMEKLSCPIKIKELLEKFRTT